MYGIKHREPQRGPTSQFRMRIRTTIRSTEKLGADAAAKAADHRNNLFGSLQHTGGK